MQGDQIRQSGLGLQAYEVCGAPFQTSRGIVLHHIYRHPDFYHAANIPRVVGGSGQGGHMKNVSVAREELRLVDEGWKLDTRVTVNADLCRAFPHRSLTPSGV